MPSLKENINIVINVRAETKDIHILCTELDKDIVTIIRYALKRMKRQYQVYVNQDSFLIKAE